MARQEFRTAVQTSGDAWTDIIVGAKTMTNLIIATQSFGLCKVSLRIMNGTTETLLVPDQGLPDGSSYRFRLGALPLMAGDKLQGKSTGAVTWNASGVSA